jgi:two-component system, OmpR family, response regulator
MTSVPPRVLVLDDEAIIRLNLCAFLEDEGFTIFSASSGEAALQLLEEQTVDVAIVDIRLPNMDGNTFVLHAHAHDPQMKFLIHTGSSSYQLPAELVTLGLQAEDVFMKPIVNMNEIVVAIQKKLT